MKNTRVRSIGTKSLLAAVVTAALMATSAYAAVETDAATTGWATQNGGTTGGAKAAKAVEVKNISDFKKSPEWNGLITQNH
ncbi:hypothetical protein OS31_00920 [Dickeya oryzae]